MVTAKQIRAYQKNLLDQIDPYLPIGGPALSLAPALRTAFLACPRHRFLERFKTTRNGPVHQLSDANLAELLPTIYSETLQIYVDQAGEVLAASNSEPGLVMYLLELLDLRPGHRVLEIGSGGGWLTAIIGHAIGSKGRVVGIEIEPALAEQSRRSLAALKCANTAIVAGDGAEGYPSGAPYDRVTITAGGDSFPAVLFDQVADQGLVILPLSNKGGGEEVFLLRRDGGCFRSEAALNAWYVPLVGDTALSGFEGLELASLPAWRRLRDRPCGQQKFWLGGKGRRDLAARSYRFRSFLGKLESNFQVFHGAPDKTAGGATPFLYGILDQAAGSLVLCDGDDLTGYGTPAALERFLELYGRWCRLFMPSGIAFDLSIYPAGAAPAPGPDQWAERRGRCDFLWSLGEPVTGPSQSRAG